MVAHRPYPTERRRGWGSSGFNLINYHLKEYNNCYFYGQLWSCYAPCSSQHLDAVQIAVEQIDVIRRLVEKYPLYLSLVSSADGKVLYCFNLT